jgi:hypothetical protein
LQREYDERDKIIKENAKIRDKLVTLKSQRKEQKKNETLYNTK